MNPARPEVRDLSGLAGFLESPGCLAAVVPGSGSMLDHVVGLAAVPPRPPAVTSPWVTLAYTLVAVVLILLGALVIKWIDARRKRPAERLSASEELARYRALFEDGEMTEQEFALIRSHLGARLRAEQEQGTPPGPSTSPAVSANSGTTAPPGRDGVPRRGPVDGKPEGGTEPSEPPENS